MRSAQSSNVYPYRAERHYSECIITN